MRAKIIVNDESEKVDEVRANNKEVENEDFLTISKIVEQKQIFEKRLKYRKVNYKFHVHQWQCNVKLRLRFDLHLTP